VQVLLVEPLELQLVEQVLLLEELVAQVPLVLVLQVLAEQQVLDLS
jgi:hypothetical protein